MGRERDTDPGAEARELLLDLRRVAVARDAIRAHVLVDGDEMSAFGRGAPGAGDTRLGIDDHVIDEAGTRERREREQRGGGKAARVGDEVGVGELRAVTLRQAVDGVRDQLRRGMLAVPLGVHLGIAQAEVGAEIDDAHVACPQFADDLRRRTVWVRDHGGIDVRVAIEVELLQRERDPVIRVDVVEPAAGVRAGGQRGQLEVRDGGAASAP